MPHVERGYIAAFTDCVHRSLSLWVLGFTLLEVPCLYTLLYLTCYVFMASSVSCLFPDLNSIVCICMFLAYLVQVGLQLLGYMAHTELPSY